MRNFVLLFVLIFGLAAADASEACKAKRDGKEHATSKCPAKKAKAPAEPSGISDEEWERNERAQLLNILQSAPAR